MKIIHLNDTKKKNHLSFPDIYLYVLNSLEHGHHLFEHTRFSGDQTYRDM